MLIAVRPLSMVVAMSSAPNVSTLIHLLAASVSPEQAKCHFKSYVFQAARKDQVPSALGKWCK
jgi:hypothetical protein